MMKTKLREKRNAADLACLLKMPQGRRVLWRIMQAARLHEHGFVPGDGLATAFHCGQKSIGLFLQSEIEQISPLLLAQMRAEYLSEVTSEQNQLNKENEELHHV
jgi:hypothetical protein